MISSKYLMEAVGTFFLVLTIGLASGSLAPVAIAGILAALIYAGGHVSGAHYNPAVSVGAWLRGALSKQDLLSYSVAQSTGAVAAAGLLYLLFDVAASASSVAAPQLVVAVEFLYTFALVFVVLSTATVKSTQPNSYFGLAIGLVVLVGAISVGSISSAVFNPAVAVGLVVMKKMALADLWLYLLAQILGGVVASYFFAIVNNHGTSKL